MAPRVDSELLLVGSLPANSTEGAWDRFAGAVTRLTRLIPDEVLVGYHLCYGTFPEWPMYEARDMGLLVDGAAGLRRRHATASRYISDFGVAMYCGFGRQPGADGTETMREHADVVRTVRGCD